MMNEPQTPGRTTPERAPKPRCCPVLNVPRISGMLSNALDVLIIKTASHA